MVKVNIQPGASKCQPASVDKVWTAVVSAITPCVCVEPQCCQCGRTVRRVRQTSLCPAPVPANVVSSVVPANVSPPPPPLMFRNLYMCPNLSMGAKYRRDIIIVEHLTSGQI